MKDRNSNWVNAKKSITLTSYQSKVQFIENWFRTNGDLGFFDGETFNLKKYLFELSGTGLENTALAEIARVFANFKNNDGSDMGIRLLTSRSKIVFNHDYDSYDFNLEFNIDDTEFKYERRLEA